MAYRFTGTRILSKRAGEGLIVVVEGTNKLMARDPMFFGERERENSVFVYRNKQAGAKTRWVRYIAVHY